MYGVKWSRDEGHGAIVWMLEKSRISSINKTPEDHSDFHNAVN